jgi:nucleotide-binding universal stress UspA family protein
VVTILHAEEEGGLIPRVIAAVDGSAADRPVLSCAAEIGRAFGASVQALHVAEPKRSQAAAVAEAAGVELRVVPGPVPDGLIAASREENVLALVMGTRATVSGPRPAGHVALAVAEGAGCPLVVVPPDCRLPFQLRRVLVPLEAVARTATALQRTLRRAAGAGLEVLVIHVMDQDSLPLFSDQPQYESEAWLREFRLRYIPSAEGVSVGVRAGSPADEVVAVTAQLEADMVVLAWSQRLAPGRARLVRSVLERSSVPVLLLPIAADPADASGATAGGS